MGGTLMGCGTSTQPWPEALLLWLAGTQQVALLFPVSPRQHDMSSVCVEALAWEDTGLGPASQAAVQH